MSYRHEDRSVTLKPMSLYCWSNWREPTQTLENSCCEATVLTTIHWGVCVVHLGLNPVSPTIRNRACDISVTLVTWVMRTKHSSTIYSAMWCTKNKRCTLIIHYAFYCILTFFKVVFLANVDLNIWSKWKRRFASGFLHVETKRWYKQSAPLLLLNISCISIFKIVSIHLSKLSLVGLLGHFYELENFYPSVHRTISLQCQEALQWVSSKVIMHAESPKEAAEWKLLSHISTSLQQCLKLITTTKKK